MYKDLISRYLEEISLESGDTLDNIKIKFNRDKNFYIPYDKIEMGIILNDIKYYADLLGYKLIFSYELDKKYYNDLLYFTEYLKSQKYIEPIDIRLLNTLNIVKVGLDIEGYRRLDIFDRKKQANKEKEL